MSRAVNPFTKGHVHELSESLYSISRDGFDWPNKRIDLPESTKSTSRTLLAGRTDVHGRFPLIRYYTRVETNLASMACILKRLINGHMRSKRGCVHSVQK